MTIISVLTIFHFDFLNQNVIKFHNISIINGIEVDSPRILVIYSLSILLWVFILMFGVSYYKLVKKTKELRDIVEYKTKYTTKHIKEILLISIKDSSYVVDAVVGFYYPMGPATKIISIIVIIAFVIFIAVGQFITIITISAFNLWIGGLLFFFYLTMYSIFLYRLPRLYCDKRTLKDTLKYYKLSSFLSFNWLRKLISDDGTKLDVTQKNDNDNSEINNTTKNIKQEEVSKKLHFVTIVFILLICVSTYFNLFGVIKFNNNFQLFDDKKISYTKSDFWIFTDKKAEDFLKDLNSSENHIVKNKENNGTK
jgi:hypothetical protein